MTNRTGTEVMRSSYRKLDHFDAARLIELKDQGAMLYDTILALGASREASLALTKLEESIMWATKALTT